MFECDVGSRKREIAECVIIPGSMKEMYENKGQWPERTTCVWGAPVSNGAKDSPRQQKFWGLTTYVYLRPYSEYTKHSRLARTYKSS